jgi:NADH:ubiquinone oxidoreductase subunit E
MSCHERKIESILEIYSHTGRDSLIPILQEIQEQVGCLNEEAVVLVGKHLNIPTSKIYGLATFLINFDSKKKGNITCSMQWYIVQNEWFKVDY